MRKTMSAALVTASALTGRVDPMSGAYLNSQADEALLRAH